MNLFLQVVFPVIFIFMLGFALQKWKKVDLKPISTLTIYILTPSLVFRTFYQTDMNIQYLMMVLFALLLFFSLIVVNVVYARARKYSKAEEGGMILSTAFMNSGNYGAPVMLFAYGELGFAYAISLMVLHSIMMNFFGVYYATRGQVGIKLALYSVFKLPAIYAAVVALLLQVLHWEVPVNLFAVVDLVAEATIPVVMLILGMQLAEIRLKRMNWEKISYGVVVRMFVSPAIAYGLVMALPLEPLLQKVLIVASAMPSAAMAVMYAIQFDSDPELVSSITLVTTLVSVLTVTALLWMLG